MQVLPKEDCCLRQVLSRQHIFRPTPPGSRLTVFAFRRARAAVSGVLKTVYRHRADAVRACQGSKKGFNLIKQCTLKQSISAVGIGLHTGRKVKLVMHPAAPDTGIIFRRVDLTPTVELPVRAEAVNDTRLATTLNEGKVVVSTIEHLMSAFNGLGIDNLYVDVDAPEIPIMDGSGATFVYLIRSAGILSRGVPPKGEEVALLLSGSIELEVENDTCVLHAGDSIRIKSGLKHRWRNVGEEGCVLVFAISPPDF